MKEGRNKVRNKRKKIWKSETKEQESDKTKGQEKDELE